MKKAIVPVVIAATMLLTSCSSIDNFLEKEIFRRAAIQTDSEYQEYEQLNEAGQLSDSGVYNDTDIFDSEDTAEENMGAIRVTFADNQSLQIQYYEDAALTKPIDVNACYLNAGDAIYALAESVNSKSNLYNIAEYRVYAYDAKGNRECKEVTKVTEGAACVYQIPSGFSEKELSIVPVGTYQDRELSMRAYYIDDDGNEKAFVNAGTWYVNGTQCTGTSTTISSLVSYILKYDFEEENYFFVSSDPKCFTTDPDSVGFVEFEDTDPTSDNSEYSVQLHKYIDFTIELSEQGTLSINEEEPVTIKKGKTWSSAESKLKYGDRIVIKTAGECNIINGDYSHIEFGRDEISEGYQYTIDIVQEPEETKQNDITVNHDVTITLPDQGAYGACTYTLDGKKVSGTVTMKESQTLQLTYKITDSAYTFKNASLWNRMQDLVGDMKKTIDVQIEFSMDRTTLDPEQCLLNKGVEIVRKGA